ncbi:MAG: CbtB-domain containing protein [Nitrososphaera sp.]
MSTISKQLVIVANNVPKVAVGILAAIALLGVFAIGFDSGQIEQAFGVTADMNGNNPGMTFLHEFAHDARHVAGFMCH